MNAETDWYGPEAATFGDRLTAAREAANMTQGMLAKRLGVRLATLRAWENDHSEPRANRLSMLAGLLNVSMRWLITGEGDGLEAPSEGSPDQGDMGNLLLEMRRLSTEMHQKAEEMARLEKRMRRLLDTPALA
ncbi:MAG: helix-turn-helix transcriptional regulator [Sulfitobacter sp.]|nr:helix-turn-helix transcriptional regulator [Sulfitobacter sp.]